MANAPTPAPVAGVAPGRPRLGEFLVAAGCITRAQLQLALREQSSWGGRLGQNLVDQGFIDEGTLAGAIARQLSLHYIDLERTPPQLDAVRLVPLWLAERYGIVGVLLPPDGGRIFVACVDPTNNEAMREVRRVTGLVPLPCVATASQIDRVVRCVYYGEVDPEPSPDPNLHLTLRRVAREPQDEAPEGAARLAGVERRLDQLLDLVVAAKRRS
jgi:hypothetical protein